MAQSETSQETNENAVQTALTQFVLRVANGKATSEAEIAVLPEIARLVLENY